LEYGLETRVKLAIFDIDGTLIDSSALDTQCFLDAFDREFGLKATAIDWSDYVHHTDRGLVYEFLQRAWSRAPSEEEIRRHRTAFMQLLRDRIGVLEEIRGARRFLTILKQNGWRVALATGAWSESAKLKLAAARFPADLPVACCDDCAEREDILRLAIDGRTPEQIVVFGDGWWDARAAANLQLPFIGIGSRSGAAHAIPDFANAEDVLALMLDAPRMRRANSRTGD
jgi:beta-phosphoglucomutase-like phosphatase (HAD superfamily)